VQRFKFFPSENSPDLAEEFFAINSSSSWTMQKQELIKWRNKLHEKSRNSFR
jgi:hypothetical protein